MPDPAQVGGPEPGWDGECAGSAVGSDPGSNLGGGSQDHQTGWGVPEPWCWGRAGGRRGMPGRRDASGGVGPGGCPGAGRGRIPPGARQPHEGAGGGRAGLSPPTNEAFPARDRRCRPPPPPGWPRPAGSWPCCCSGSPWPPPPVSAGTPGWGSPCRGCPRSETTPFPSFSRCPAFGPAPPGARPAADTTGGTLPGGSEWGWRGTGTGSCCLGAGQDKALFMGTTTPPCPL